MATITATRQTNRPNGAIGVRADVPMSAETLTAELIAAGYRCNNGVWSKPGSRHRFRIGGEVRQ